MCFKEALLTENTTHPLQLSAYGYARGSVYETQYPPTPEVRISPLSLVDQEQRALPGWLDGAYAQDGPPTFARPGGVIVPRLEHDAPLDAGGWIFSARGSHHVQREMRCQDAARLECGSHIAGTPYMFLSIADGHGSHKYSDRGALHATIAAREAIMLLLEPEHDPNAQLRLGERRLREDFGRRVKNRWLEVVGESEGHGTTLLWALATPTLLALGQLGDGECWHLSPQHPPKLIFETDSELISTTTHSLSQDDSHLRWQFKVWPRSTQAEGIWMMTDGLSDALVDASVMLSMLGGSLHDREQLSRWWDHGKLHQNIVDWASAGSGDDVTVALLHVGALGPALTPCPQNPDAQAHVPDDVYFEDDCEDEPVTIPIDISSEE